MILTSVSCKISGLRSIVICLCCCADMGVWFLSYVSWCSGYLWFSSPSQWWCLISKCLQMLSSLGLSSRTMDKSLVEFHTKTLVALVPSIFHRISRDRQIPLLQVGTYTTNYSWIVRIFLYLVVPCYAHHFLKWPPSQGSCHNLINPEGQKISFPVLEL